MTDELEALLEEEDEEEPGEPLSRRPTRLGGRRNPPTIGDMTPPPEKPHEEPAARNGTAGGSEEGAAARGKTQGAEVDLQRQAAAEPMWNSPRRAAVSEKGETALLRPGGQTLYANMARSRRAVDYRPVSGGTWRPLEKGSSPPGGTAVRDAAALDRIFQRDARRYDGGFTWL